MASALSTAKEEFVSSLSQQAETEQAQEASTRSGRAASFWQIARFSAVGMLNTALDIATLNLLLWRFPTHQTSLLLLWNSIACLIAALNSYVCNKYWTFRVKQTITTGELARFALVSAGGFVCNNAMVWGVSTLLHPFIASSVLWANSAKLCAVVGTAIVSYAGMRLWVFARGYGALS